MNLSAQKTAKPFEELNSYKYITSFFVLTLDSKDHIHLQNLSLFHPFTIIYKTDFQKLTSLEKLYSEGTLNKSRRVVPTDLMINRDLDSYQKK